MKVEVDEDRCAGHGMCLTLCPEVFDLSDDGWAVAAPGEVPTQPPSGSGRDAPFADESSSRGGRTHTTLVTVVTNARLDAVGCFVVAQGGHDGLARALTPPHTRFDGDAVVAAATGEIDPDDEAGPGLGIDLVRMLAVHAVAEAIRGVARTD